MRGITSLPMVVAVLLCGVARVAAAACMSEPTPTCLLADAQVTAMAMTDTANALGDFSFIGWAQAAAGDVEGARDTLRVADLRSLGAAPERLANYHAGIAGIWAVLGDAARAKAAIEAARAHLGAADAYSRAFALADAAYAQAFLGDAAATAETFRQALEAARGPGGDSFLLAYVAWNQALVGDHASGLAAIRDAVDHVDAQSTLALWTLGYAAVTRSLARDPSAADTRDRHRLAVAAATPDAGQNEGWMMLAWSMALGGDHARAETLVREHLPDAYAADPNSKAIALTYAALALAPATRLGP